MKSYEIPKSIMEKVGIKVTTRCKLGGVGFGYTLPNEYWKGGLSSPTIAWQDGGNGFYYPKDFDEVIVDGGKGYIERVTRMLEVA